MKKRKILIIGGTSGIGYDISGYFDKEKFKIISVGRKLLLDKQQNVDYLFYDLLNKKKLQLFYKQLNKIKKLDIVIYTIGGSLGLNNLNYYDLFKVWYLNCGLIIKINDYLIKKKILTKNSNIIHFSSMAATDLSGRPGYNMSKKYMELYTIELAKKLSNMPIKVNCIKPSITLASNNNWYKLKNKNYKKFKSIIKKHHYSGIPGKSLDIFYPIKTLLSKKKLSGFILKTNKPNKKK